MSETNTKKKSTTIDNKVVENVKKNVTNKKIEKVEKLYGLVENCKLLRVRKEPDINSNVITTIPAGTEVELLERGNSTTTGFYRVHIILADGSEIDGYCMDDYIHVNR